MAERVFALLLPWYLQFVVRSRYEVLDFVCQGSRFREWIKQTKGEMYYGLVCGRKSELE